jgi:putative flippase GtrA
VARVAIVRALYSRFEHLVHELSKFGTVGAVALVVNMAVFNVMLATIKDKQIVATVVSTAVATVVAYIGNRHWTYRDRTSAARASGNTDRQREMFFFFLINGVAAVIEVVAVFVAKYGFGQDGSLAVNIAKYGFGLPLGMLFRLITYRTWVFPQAVEPEYVPAAASTPLFAPPALHAHTQHGYQQPVAETVSR